MIRIRRELPRYLLCSLAVAGLVASARFAIAPPRPAASAGVSYPLAAPDRAAEGFAALFARRYLTWDAADPLASQSALEAFGGPGMEPDAALQLPVSGRQRVEWVEVVQEREPAAGQHVYTLAAQTDTAGLLYLTVSVERATDGRLALAGYPAIVGAPASGPAQAPALSREVADPTLVTVVQRALRNYLAASPGELAADLTSGARVSFPGMPLTLVATQRVDWSSDGRSVVAVVQARDSRGVQYTLSYELDVVRVAGRWEISALQVDPDA
jgi:Conjugative transposon protein TcpC